VSITRARATDEVLPVFGRPLTVLVGDALGGTIGVSDSNGTVGGGPLKV
jgi:hypothetical protein